MPKYRVPDLYGTLHLANGKTAKAGDVVEMDAKHAADIGAEPVTEPAAPSTGDAASPAAPGPATADAEEPAPPARGGRKKKADAEEPGPPAT